MRRLLLGLILVCGGQAFAEVLGAFPPPVEARKLVFHETVAKILETDNVLFVLFIGRPAYYALPKSNENKAALEKLIVSKKTVAVGVDGISLRIFSFEY